MLRTLTLAASTVAFLAASAAPAQKFTPPRKRPVDNSVASVGRTPMTVPADQAGTAAVPAGQAAAAPAPAATPAPVPTTTIAQALPTLPNHATLNRLVTAANLGETLAGPGPFTVFAPADDAFARMPAGAIDTLLKPEAQASLATILKYHVVAGKLTAEQIKAQIAAGNGTATLTTLAGQPLTATNGENGTILLTDVNGQKAYVGQADLVQTNGVVHVTNGVSFPKLG